MTLPLEGLKVLDLSRILAGPYCSMILGDLGADIIKVEAPGGSDETRNWGPPFIEGESAYYLCTNRNKRGMTLDLKSHEGKEIFFKLVESADVVIQNFRVGTMERLGLGYENLKNINPGIIYCSISGFGQTGPYKDLPGYDHLIQAMGGLMSITGQPEDEPMKVGVAVADMAAGLYGVIGILSALQSRIKTGEGQEIDISLLDAQVSLLANVASNYLISGNIPKRYGNQHPNIAPYQVFSTADGEMVLCVGSNTQFTKLCDLLSCSSLSQEGRFLNNSQRLQNRDELVSILGEFFIKKPTKEWLGLLQKEGIPCGPINDMPRLFQDPHVIEREMLLEMNHPTIGKFKYVGSPLKLSKNPVQYRKHPPLVGESTEEVLVEMGLTQVEIESLKVKKVI
jgi:crotonobetainyl-CoA:carnitine CoA-transferase CaiB-like acyl-CoA transferase